MPDGDGARSLLPRQKAHRDGIAARRRQGQALPVRPIAQQRVGHLDQAAGAVADQRVGADRAAMVEIDQDLQPARDDIVRFSSLDIGDETDTARIMLVARVVETLSLGQCHRGCSSPDVVDTKLAGCADQRRRERHNMHKIGEDANCFNAGLIQASSEGMRPQKFGHCRVRRLVQLLVEYRLDHPPEFAGGIQEVSPFGCSPTIFRRSVRRFEKSSSNRSGTGCRGAPRSHHAPRN